MLRSKFRKAKKDAVAGFLGSQTEFIGKLSFSGVVHLDGRFEGEIISRGTLVVGSDSVVNAHVRSNVLKISGEVYGDLAASEKIELYAPAKVFGSIRTPSLVVEEGALFEGTCSMASVKEDIPQLHDPDAEPAHEQESLEAISAHAWPPSYDEERPEADESDEEPLTKHDQ